MGNTIVRVSRRVHSPAQEKAAKVNVAAAQQWCWENNLSAADQFNLRRALENLKP